MLSSTSNLMPKPAKSLSPPLSINPAYDPMVFEKGDINSLPVSILGKVIEVRTTL